MTITVGQRSDPVRIESIAKRHAWNDLITGLPECALEQGFEWGEILKESGYEPYRFAVFDGDNCLAAISMLRWHPPMLQSSILYAPRGPLIASDSGPARRALGRTIEEIAAATREVFLRASPGAAACRAGVHAALVEAGFVRLPEEWTVWNAPRIVMTLKLEGSEDAVWSRISDSRRREIKLTESAGVNVVAAPDASDLGLFYEFLLRNACPARRRRHFEAICREYRASGSGILLLAGHHGDIVGGLSGAKLGRTAYFLDFTITHRRAVDSEQLHVAPLLYWHFIRWARASSCESIHWGGIRTRRVPTPGEPDYEMYQFKRSFGSECMTYGSYYDRVLRSGMYRLLRTAERRYGDLVLRILAQTNR